RRRKNRKVSERAVRALVQSRVGIALRVNGTQAVQLSAGSRELLAQFGHLVLKPASPQSIELHSIPTSQSRIAGYRISNGQSAGIRSRAGPELGCDDERRQLTAGPWLRKVRGGIPRKGDRRDGPADLDGRRLEGFGRRFCWASPKASKRHRCPAR